MGLMNKDGLFRPLIGITPAYSYDEEKIYINNGYMEAVNRAGGLAVLLPLTDNDSLIMDFIKMCDGFLISGGPDIDAKYYGENNLAFNGTISPLRDIMEICIVKKAFKAKKPILGICRGIQILNVAMGGTLYQDINSQIKGENILKHSQNAPRWYPVHEIYIERDSIIWEIFKTEIARVNSFHHQAVKDIAQGFMATSKAADGVIESIEYVGQHVRGYSKEQSNEIEYQAECEADHVTKHVEKQKQFSVGVQWHPEIMWKKDATYLKIFERFICAAKRDKNI